MMISISDVRNRQMKLNNTNYCISTNASLANKKTLSRDIKLLESVLKNWKALNGIESFALQETFSLAESFINNENNNLCDRNRVIDILKEAVLPSVKQIKSIKSLVQDFEKHITLESSLMDSIENIVVCDRIISNQNKLNKKINIEESLSSIQNLSKRHKLDAINKICYTIDTMYENVDIATKYNVSLENTLYTLTKLGIKDISKSEILNEVSSFFLLRDLEPNQLDYMDRVVKESDIYTTTNSAHVGQELLNFNLNNGSYIKEPMDIFIRSTNKTHQLFNGTILAFFSKPNEIVKETPVILNWISRIILFSTIRLDVVFSGLDLFVDQFITHKNNKEGTRLLINSFMGEKRHIEHTVDLTQEQSIRKDQYLDNLEICIKRLCDYRDTIYDAPTTDNISESSYAENYISIEDYLNTKNSLTGMVTNSAYNSLKQIISSRYESLLDNEVLQLEDESIVKKYGYLREDNISSYLGVDNQLYFPIGFYLPLNGTEEDQENAINILDTICTELTKELHSDYGIFYDGNDDMYTIFILYCTTIEFDVEDDISESFNDYTMDSILLIENIKEEFKRYQENINSTVIKESIYNTLLLDCNKPLMESIILLCESADVIDKDKMIRSIKDSKKSLFKNAISISELDYIIDISNNLSNEKYIKRKIESICKGNDSFEELYNLAVYLVSTFSPTALVSIPNNIFILVVQLLLDKVSLDNEYTINKVRNLKIKIKSKYVELLDTNIDTNSFNNKKKELTDSVALIDAKLESLSVKYDNVTNESYDYIYSARGKKYIYSDILEEGINSISESSNSLDINYCSDGNDLYKKLYTCNRIMENVINYDNNVQCLNELAFLNTLKLISDKLRVNLSKLSDKEKAISKKIDNSVERFTNDVKKSFASKNREAVIKGNVLPSASDLLKTCIINAGLGFVTKNPAVAVVGTLGTIAMSKSATKKERQFILDEIEIQLNVVDKKLSMAESNSDMKAYEELLRIQKKLKREEQRIKYNLKNYYPINKGE